MYCGYGKPICGCKGDTYKIEPAESIPTTCTGSRVLLCSGVFCRANSFAFLRSAKVLVKSCNKFRCSFSPSWILPMFYGTKAISLSVCNLPAPWRCIWCGVVRRCHSTWTVGAGPCSGTRVPRCCPGGWEQQGWGRLLGWDWGQGRTASTEEC